MIKESGSSGRTERTGVEKALQREVKARTFHPGMHILGGQGNSIAIETDQGFVLIDAGANKTMADAFMRVMHEIKPAPVHTIIYSHGHGGYNDAAWRFLEMAEERGEPLPRIVAHENLPIRYRRYEETALLQRYLGAIQFRMPFDPNAPQPRRVYPTITFSERLRLNMGVRILDVIWAPSETDDCIAVWLPEEKVLYGGPAVIGSCVNIGTPLRTQRFDKRWADTLDKLAALGPEVLFPEFGRVDKGKDEIRFRLNNTAEGIRYLRREVTRMMNRGMTDVEILHSIEYPAEYFGHPWAKSYYGCPDWIVRDIYRSENGWWEGIPPTFIPPVQRKLQAR